MGNSFRKSFILLFILFHVIAIPSWGIFSQTAFSKALNSFTRPYFWATGLWQSWNMFSPNPLSLNIQLKVTLEDSEGEEKKIFFPEIWKRSVWEKMHLERYRKWAIDWVRFDQNSYLWRDAALFFARRYGSERTEKVILSRVWEEIPFFDSEKDWQDPWWGAAYENNFDFFQMNLKTQQLEFLHKK